MTRIIRIFIVIFSIFTNCISEKTPSLNEIKGLNNADLDEIFSSTVPRTSPESTQPLVEPTVGGTDNFSKMSGPRELPINHGHVLGPTGGNNQDFQQFAQHGANAFANGANAFYRGAASVGEAFGIPNGNYQMPLFSQAANFFGR